MQFNRIGIAKRLIIAGKFKKAKSLLRSIAEKGNREAQLILGYLYYGGDPDTSAKEAESWLKKSAKKGHPEAIALIAGTNFGTGGWATSPDTPRGLRLLELAAKRGSAEAQRNLACTYAVGEVVPYNAAKATYWYTAAAEQGYAEAQNDIAGMWLDGEAGNVDIEKAIFWYEKSASKDQNVPDAEWAAETLFHIYSGKFDQSHIKSDKAEYWSARATHLKNQPFRPHPSWFYA